MQKFNPLESLKRFILLCAVVIFLPMTWCVAGSYYYEDGYSHIDIKESTVQGTPKGSTILASINGHTLTVTFTENLGDVLVEVTTASGGTVDYGQVWTPDSFIAYIYSTGSYVVTITLENGDEYYGEFEVSD